METTSEITISQASRLVKQTKTRYHVANMSLDKNFLLINKPAGWTSFDVVGFLRKKFRQAGSKSKMKIGHAGTLDPFATGLLIVGVGREATKRLDEFKNLKKTYHATIHLGANSNTDDKTGTITEKSVAEIPTQTEVENILKNLIGKQEQIPPMFSAKTINGTRLYKLARQGIEVERQPSQIEIFEIKLLHYIYPLLEIEVSCSSGTYIRTLARTIGERLHTGGYCEELKRTAIGEFRLTEAKKPEEIILSSVIDSESKI